MIEKRIRPINAHQLGYFPLCSIYQMPVMKKPQEAFEAYEFLKKKYPQHSILMTLDDYSQAFYTSGHTINQYDLDETEGHNLKSVSSQCFEKGIHQGFLTTESEFFIRKENFRKGLLPCEFFDLCQKDFKIYSEDQWFGKYQKNPFALSKEVVYFFIVPVERPAWSIMSFPNGYFSDDLNPFENPCPIPTFLCQSQTPFLWNWCLSTWLLSRRAF